ncbi:MAG: hypothetical protein ACI8VL_000641, partial [Bacteroidia bacterium]
SEKNPSPPKLPQLVAVTSKLGFTTRFWPNDSKPIISKNTRYRHFL